MPLAEAIAVVKGARPDARLCLEMITRDPLQVPYETDGYWIAVDRPPADALARFERDVLGKAWTDPLPHISQLTARAAGRGGRRERPPQRRVREGRAEAVAIPVRSPGPDVQSSDRAERQSPIAIPPCPFSTHFVSTAAVRWSPAARAGLGRVMAEALAEAGADVALTSRSADSAGRGGDARSPPPPGAHVSRLRGRRPGRRRHRAAGRRGRRQRSAASTSS